MSLGLLGVGLVIAALALALSRRASFPARLGIAAVALAGAFVPWGGMNFAGYFLGIAGELSVTTMVLLAATISGLLGGGELVSRRELGGVRAFVLLAASFLYPMALGLTRFDPYALGYSGDCCVLSAALAVAALLAWLGRRFLLLAALVLGLVARKLQLLESPNLWDYLLDPWLTLSMALSLVASARGARFTIFDRFSKSR
ncbi:MAG: hypothetical protein ACRD3V_05165 [Vicinamibacteria bacterium]